VISRVMGSSKLKELMSAKRDRRRRQTPDGLIAGSSRGKRIKASPCQQDCVLGASTYASGQTKTEASPCQQDCVPGAPTYANDQTETEVSPFQQDCVPGASTYANGQTEASPCQQDDTSQTEECSEPNLPEDMWRHIHSLMPLKDAARAACVSRSFLSSWRCHPNLILSRQTFGWDEYLCKEETARDFRSKIDHILRNHSGTGVRKLKLCLVPNYNAEDCDYVDKWLEKVVRPGIEELTLRMPANHRYEFPCSVLSNGTGDLLRCLHLSNCSFHHIAGLGLISLTKLELFMVRILGDELCCLLSSSSALEWLSLRFCSKVNCLKIPFHLQHLRHVKVEECRKLRVVESKAPNLSSFQFRGSYKVQVSLGEALQVKNLYMSCTVYGCDTRAELASSMPSREMANSPMVSSKLTDLKSVIICLEEMPFCQIFDFPHLVSIFGASLTLDTFISLVSNGLKEPTLVFEDPSRLRMPETSGGVVSPKYKRMIKLACHILRAWLI